MIVVEPDSILEEDESLKYGLDAFEDDESHVSL